MRDTYSPPPVPLLYLVPNNGGQAHYSLHFWRALHFPGALGAGILSVSSSVEWGQLICAPPSPAALSGLPNLG